MFRKEGLPVSSEPEFPCATQFAPTTPERKEQSCVDTFNVRSNFALDSFSTAEDNAWRMSSEDSRSIRKTRSAARSSSIFSSSSSKDLASTSPVASTPFRSHTSLNVKSSGTPHLDHVLSFHQNLSPPPFSQDIFTSFALDADTYSSHESMSSYFGNRRFYASGSRDEADGQMRSDSSDDASLGSSDSSEEERQVILLPQTYSLPSVAKSAPSISVINALLSTNEDQKKPYLLSRKRSKSLSAISASNTGSQRARTNVFPSVSSIRDHVRAFSINSSSEAMHFACRSLDALEADATLSSLATYEVVGNLQESAQNGKRAMARRRMITKPLGRLQKAVIRLLA